MEWITCNSRRFKIPAIIVVIVTSMAEISTEPLREKLLRAFFPRVKRRTKEHRFETKDPLECFESAILEESNQRLRDREQRTS